MTTPEVSPMMKQFNDAKAVAKDALLLFRMGDFYELFFDDAYKAANALGITVTTRDRNKGENATPMAGFPHQHLETYLAKLISAGYKVAVCEQMEDPKKTKNIVKREVVRIVTPGTVMDESILDPRESNYLAAVAFPPNVLKNVSGRYSGSTHSSDPFRSRCSNFGGSNSGGSNSGGSNSGGSNSGDYNSDNNHADAVNPEGDSAMVIDPRQCVGLAWVDLSTGQFHAMTLSFSQLFDQLGRIHPSECLIPEAARSILPLWLTENVMLSDRPDWVFSATSAQEALFRHFQVKTLEGFGFTEATDIHAVCAAGAVLDYLIETQKQSLEHIETLLPYRTGEALEMDEASRRSLEIVQTIRDGRRDGSLLSVLDHCVTSMGSRLLSDWVAYPLKSLDQILVRQDAVEELIHRFDETESVRSTLRNVCDLERIMARVVQERATPRDLGFVGRTLQVLPIFKDFLERSSCSLLKTLGKNIDLLSELADELDRALGDEPPLSYKEGGFIRDGYSARLDELRQLQRGGKEWLTQYQAQEVRRTGIPTLKIGFTSVFGYYLEVTNAQSEHVPADYIRKQTLKNAERYITPELKEYEEKVLTAEEKAKELELELLGHLRRQVMAVRVSVQRAAGVLAHLDTLAGLASLASTRNYQRPTMVEEPIFHIVDGRHPVLELTEKSGSFVPNNTFCDEEHGTIHLITGPNMSGKSTFIRQIALLTLMAQVGSFIPAQSATIGIVDRIFARVGASDELTRGQSTFMVEMVETARILNGATSQSLVILDEIGRGTSTYDGISLAWAIVEYLHERIACRTFFATHYHELTDLAQTYPGINNLNVAVREWNDEIAFLHKIIPGAADKSYGIHVARLAGVPREVVQRARAILTELEETHVGVAKESLHNAFQTMAKVPFGGQKSENDETIAGSGTIQFSLFGPEDHPIVDEIRCLNLDETTPLEALTLLQRWKTLLTQESKRKRRR